MRFKKRAVTFVISLASLVGCEFGVQKKPESDCATSLKKTGFYAPEDYIRSDCYKSLIIEIDCVEGVSLPNTDVMNTLEKRLKKIIDKPKGISYFVDDPSIVKEKDEYHLDDLYLLAKQHRSFGIEKLPQNVLSLYILYVNGVYRISDKHTAVGVALDNGAIMIFKNCIKPEQELALITHEIGHVLGLVNGRIPQQQKHEDKEHLGHDVNPACVMYYKLTSINSSLFDQQCLDDIHFVKNK